MTRFNKSETAAKKIKRKLRRTWYDHNMSNRLRCFILYCFLVPLALFLWPFYILYLFIRSVRRLATGRKVQK
jgi:hypothetical protein